MSEEAGRHWRRGRGSVSSSELEGVEAGGAAWGSWTEPQYLSDVSWSRRCLPRKGPTFDHVDPLHRGRKVLCRWWSEPSLWWRSRARAARLEQRHCPARHRGQPARFHHQRLAAAGVELGTSVKGVLRVGSLPSLSGPPGSRADNVEASGRVMVSESVWRGEL